MTGAEFTDQDRLTRWLQESLPQRLPGFLVEQRWFGGKARGIRAASVADLALLNGGAAGAFVVTEVAYLDGSTERYGLLVVQADDPGSRPAIGPTDEPGLPAWALEAAADHTCLGEVLAGFAHGRDVPTLRGGSLQYRDVTDVARHAIAHASTVVPVRSEQSNTSIRVGASLVFKLFRRLPAGENPEVEMGRFLATRTAFRATPALHGSLTYIDPSGQPSTLGVLQTWVDGARDGWEYITTRLARAGEETVARELAAAMAQLGATTAAFHAALASDTEVPTFRPEMIEAGELEKWSAGLSAQASRSTDLVRRYYAGWTGDARALGEAFLALATGVPAVAADFARDATERLWKIRVHGDYHLGQTLKTQDGFAIIDFEGEPSRPLDERRRKLCALKDVAGMLRSFDYAIETVSRRVPADTRGLPFPLDLRPAFLTSYLEAAHRAPVACVPRERETAERWLKFFEFDKALYELEYEINNRPEWVDIPLRWIVRNLEARRGLGQ